MNMETCDKCGNTMHYAVYFGYKRKQLCADCKVVLLLRVIKRKESLIRKLKATIEFDKTVYPAQY